MKPFRNMRRLLLGALAVAMFATVGTSPALPKASDRMAVSPHKKVNAYRRARRLARSSAAVAPSSTIPVSATAMVLPGLKPTESSGSSGACPSNPAGFKEAGNVGALVESSGATSTYIFESFAPENTGNGTGVPGLVKYCVYPGVSKAPSSIAVTAKGENGESWIVVRKGKGSNFSFSRPSGNKSNIPLDGEDHEMGTATWSGETAPTGQTVLLHINDQEECVNLYGAESPATCFVLPGERPTARCTTGAGSGDFAYNALPFDFGKGCPTPPSWAFEAQQTSEFGDEVVLAGGTEITSMAVDFQSYGCSVSGHWNTGDCVTKEGETFTIPASEGGTAGITAHIYEVVPGTPDTAGKEIATGTNTEPIPYRPTATPGLCPETKEEEEELEKEGIQPKSRWLDSVSGKCVFSISKLIPFTFSPTGAVPAGGKVIWTVSFNTTHYGFHPFGTTAACFSTAGGCGYDSLNVGTKSYAEKAFAGEDVNADGVFINKSSTPANVKEATGWTGLRPLAQITTAGP